MSRSSLAALAAWLTLVVPAGAQTIVTLDEVVARARDRAAAVRIARARVAEAESLLLDASARPSNPVLEGSLGPRSGAGSRSVEVDIGLSQQFEPGARRRARVAGAQATVDRQRADVAQIARRAVFDAAATFLDGLAGTERVRASEAANAVSRQILAATERRYAAGDVAAIDLNLARIDAARTAAALMAARADLAETLGALRLLTSLPEGPLELRGSLDAAALPPMAQLESAIERRPEFAVLDADVREAEAQVQLGRALRKAELGIRVGYEREASDSILLGGLTVTLPAFQRGQGTVAGGLARAARVRLERETLRQAALTELRTAFDVYTQRAELASALARDAGASLDDNDTLAQRSYEAGEMNLMDLLLVRRNALEARTTLLDRRLDAATSRLAVNFIAGVLR